MNTSQTKPNIIKMPFVGFQAVVDGVLYNYSKENKEYVANTFTDAYKAIDRNYLGDGTDNTYYKHCGNSTAKQFFAKQLDLFS